MKYKTKFSTLVMASALLAAALPAVAHHSFPAQYDAEMSITLTGNITKVEWTNPHIFIYLDVADAESGEVANWALEMGGPNALIRLGWKRDSLKPDDLVTIEGSLARDGSNLVNVESIIMVATGERMLAGSSRDTSNGTD